MLLDARQLPAGTKLEAEVCVVGAGAAGITLALALRDAGFRVLVLESGGLEFEEATQALYAGQNVGVPNYDLEVCRTRFFGGSTNCWAGWCRPLEPVDFAPPDAPALRTWPLRRADLDPYYAKAQTVCQLGPYNYDDLAPWSDATGLTTLQLDPHRLKTALFQVSPPTRFGTVYRDALATAASVTVYLYANVLELQTDETASRVQGVRATSLSGPEFQVSARLVVLATGGLENARLLLLSNRVQPAGLGNTHDVVGRYFMDHLLLTSAAFAAFATTPKDMQLYFEQTSALGTSIFGTLSSAIAEPDIGGFRVWLRPRRKLVEGINSLKALGAAMGSMQLPPEGIWHHVRHVLTDYDAIADATYKTLFHTKKALFASSDPGNEPIAGAYLDINWEQFPDPTSRVTLSAARDALGQNELTLDWQPKATEKRTLHRAIELVAQEFGRLGLGRVKAMNLPDGDSWPWELEGSRHHMGTTRMSNDPRTGVVDGTCRVHGVANLYVAGCSVFPTSGYANPTLTIVALALRLSDEIRRQLT
jgi:choline dehydrogenase-like flavoprotein